MEQLSVESNKSYFHGFILKESDLRRILDLINDQLKKLATGTITYSYILKFENGAIATTDDIETVLKQDNEGSSAIVRLEIEGKHSNDLTDTLIQLSFRNLDSSNESGDIPIKHIISGKSRDWVFVTSSLIEERINKIKRKSLDKVGERGFSRLFIKLLAPFFMMFFFMIVLFSLPDSVKDSTKSRITHIEQLEKKWKNKTITDPIELILDIHKFDIIEKTKFDSSNFILQFFFTKPIIVYYVSIIFIFISFYFFSKYYPVYNFAWGGYLEVFNKKENNRKFAIGIIIGTIMLGIIVNLLSNYIWEKI